ncbi:MAG: hypothetical protein II661_10105 [Bacteroidales bacterium]|nr:hypothetical protein [Bacteroidales bacterium]
MSNEEFSNSFSTLLNSYGTVGEFGDQASRQEIVLDEYEKSVLLTQAQDIIVKSYYDRTLNPQGQGFDDTARRQADFSSLITVVELPVYTPNNATKYDDRGIFFHLPTTGGDTPAVLLIQNEKLLLMESSAVVREYVVKPISYAEYDRQMSKAYTKPLKKQAWRLFQNPTSGFDISSEVIPRVALGQNQSWKYRIRYVRRPRPIVLEDFTGTGVSIDGVTTATECELNPILHMDILLKAVELAQSTRGVVRPERTNQRAQ